MAGFGWQEGTIRVPKHLAKSNQTRQEGKQQKNGWASSTDLAVGGRLFKVRDDADR